MREYKLSINGNPYCVSVLKVTDEEVVAEVNGVKHVVAIDAIKTLNPIAGLPPGAGETAAPVALVPPVQPSTAPATSSADSKDLITSPIPGHILEVCVSVGEEVLAGQKLLVLEAMKLENIITAPRTGVIKKLLVAQGDAVTHGQAMVELD